MSIITSENAARRAALFEAEATRQERCTRAPDLAADDTLWSVSPATVIFSGAAPDFVLTDDADGNPRFIAFDSGAVIEPGRYDVAVSYQGIGASPRGVKLLLAATYPEESGSETVEWKIHADGTQFADPAEVHTTTNYLTLLSNSVTDMGGGSFDIKLCVQIGAACNPLAFTIFMIEDVGGADVYAGAPGCGLNAFAVHMRRDCVSRSDLHLAAIEFHRAVLASALAADCSPASAMTALRELGTGGV